jgi:Mrp family chromosome partitioning ATPase
MLTSASRYHSAPCVAVLGGCGGAGASTLAAGLARSALHSGRAVVLVDGDPLGGGLETILADELSSSSSSGSEYPQRLREPGLTVLSWGRPDGAAIPPDAMRLALGELAGTAELLVVDLPRTLGDAARVAAAYATHSLLIVPVAERAAVSSHRLLTQLGVLGPRPGLVARLPSRDLLDPPQLARLLRLPLSGVVKAGRDRSTLQRASLDRFCLRFVDSLFGSVTA